MTVEIYLWLESRTGIPFNFEDSFQSLMTDIIATDHNQWLITIRDIIDLTKDAIDAVDEFADEIPDDLPDARKMKSIIAENTRDNMRVIMKHALRILGLVIPDELVVWKLTTMWNITKAMSDLIEKLITDNIDDILKTDWFDKYDDNNDNILSYLVGISKHDLTNLSIAIESIREYHEENDDDEDSYE